MNISEDTRKVEAFCFQQQKSSEKLAKARWDKKDWKSAALAQGESNAYATVRGFISDLSDYKEGNS